MEAVTTFALAAGILQVVDLSFKALGKCQELYKNGSLAEHQSTAEITKHLADTVGRLKATMDQTAGPRSQDDTDVFDISTKCSRTAEELLAELKFLQPDSRRQLRQAIRKSFRTIRMTDAVAKIQKKLEGYQRVLDTRILVRLDAHTIQQRQDFQRLDQGVQDLVIAMNHGQNTVAKLLSYQAQAIRDHIDQRLGQQEKTNNYLRAQEQFKQSLFFPEIHARQEQIHGAHSGTCRWIFHPSSPENGSLGTHIHHDTSTGPIQRRQFGELDIQASSENGDSNNKAGDGDGQTIADDSQATPHRDTESSSDARQGQPWSNFVDWLELGGGVYWINGKAGSGKSTLMNYISNEIRTKKALTQWAKGSDLLITSFFFWNPGTFLQRSFQGFLRSLLYGIANRRQDLISIMMDQEQSSIRRANESRDLIQIHAWTEERLLSVLRHFLMHKPPSISICVFIDGLDEFTGEEDVLIETIRLLDHAPQIKVCASSRPEQIFRQEFGDAPQLRLQDFNRKDILKTAADKLYPALKDHLARDKRQADQFIEDVSSQAQGVFLWLDIVIKDIIRGARNRDTMQELSARLQIMPDTIDGLYGNMLSRLDKLYLPDASKFFGCLMVKRYCDSERRRLTLLEFAFAESGPWGHLVRNDLPYFESSEFHDTCRNLEVRIITRCAGLIEVEEHWDKSISGVYEGSHRSPTSKMDTSQEEGNISRYLQKVDFIHRTAMDFLRGRGQALLQGFNCTSAACLAVARGQLGLMATIPITIGNRSLGKDRVSIPGPIEAVVDTLSVFNEFEATEETDRTVEDAVFGMVGQTFQIINNVNSSFNGPNPYWYDWYRGDQFYLDSLGSLPFRDCPGFAAFFGCRSYVLRYISSRNCTRTELNYLIACTLIGLMRISPHKVVQSFALVETLLHQGADPNLPLCLKTSPRTPQFVGVCDILVWTLFIMLAYRTIVDCWDLLIKLEKSFLLHGTEVNASIFSELLSLLPTTYTAFVLEESPLSFLERHMDVEAPLPKELMSWLPPQSAVHYRRFRMICFIKHDQGKENRSGISWHQTSQNQSERLCAAYPWSRAESRAEKSRKAENVNRVVEEIKDSLTGADEVDPSNFILRSSFKSKSKEETEM